MDKAAPDARAVSDRLADWVVRKGTHRPNVESLVGGFARRLIEAHRGTLELMSEPGKGTRVRVFFPMKPEG